MTKPGHKIVNLALQGGGSHGAFGWGILDYLLEDGRLRFEGVSASSAGSVNAVVLAQGLLNDDYEEARNTLHDFWRSMSDEGLPFASLDPFREYLNWGTEHPFNLDSSISYNMFDMMARILSPYQFNPLNLNPLKALLEDKVNFTDINKHSNLKIFLSATNVESCKLRIFTTGSLTVESVLASACLPLLFQAVEIDGEHYWDGGYIGNPAIFPLIYECKSSDVVVIHISPIGRKGVPMTAAEILNRVNEVCFNSSLMREMRAISFVTKLIDKKVINDTNMKRMYIHSIRADAEMAQLNASTKLNIDWAFLTYLKEQGRTIAKIWMDENFDTIGKSSSIDIDKEFV